MGPLLLCHGVLDNDLAKIWPGTDRLQAETSTELDALLTQDHYRFIINGHVHYRTLIYFQTATLLNAGTLKQRHRPGFSELDFARGTVSAFEFDQGRCVPAGEYSLSPESGDRVWTNTAEFDGNWQPKVLYLS